MTPRSPSGNPPATEPRTEPPDHMRFHREEPCDCDPEALEASNADSLRDLTEVVGKALYGWGDDEPNGATGKIALIEVARVSAAVHEAGYRREAAAATPSLDVDRLAEAMEATWPGWLLEAPTKEAAHIEMLEAAETLAAEYLRSQHPAQEPDTEVTPR